MINIDFRPPIELTSLNRSAKNCRRWWCLWSLLMRKIWCKSVYGGFWAKQVKCNQLSIYTIFLRNSPAGETVRRIFTIDRLAQLAEVDHATMCLLGVRLYYAPFWGSNHPKLPLLGGMNRHFPTKCAKYWNLRIIESNPSIATKFCTMIETGTCPLLMIQIRSTQI